MNKKETFTYELDVKKLSDELEETLARANDLVKMAAEIESLDKRLIFLSIQEVKIDVIRAILKSITHTAKLEVKTEE